MSMTAEAPASAPVVASGSSFYTAMRILPRAQREAMYAVYGFCRVVDDVADSDGPRPPRLAELEAWRGDLDRFYRNGATTARTATLADAVRTFRLRQEDFLAVIDGMEMDVLEDQQAPDWATLNLYCDRVASAVGRLSVRVFGMEEGAGIALSHHLGLALQLTNILRDVDEDAAMRRLYLPREALRRAGIEATAPDEVLAHPGLAKACDEVAAEARRHFTEAELIMRNAPRKAVRAPRLMATAYRSVLDRVVARGFAAPRERVGVDKVRLILSALRHGIL
ncbi:farnesyl-diphosphate farnesyltransferase [Faunimonas pinastri]|uniref:Farnesyl-diphosphate farnesyltransferase n=1 Tax=Faunimonas pinastri TaxID=1855383 RepID=A0A1H9AI14_9HYPH|nr:presqualene diphosphate synthase HpnD [Faunimonas pinastri]SEP76384.1 farnesyl-diphosphate farnesyltransferase [Faunimonas pinastri]